PLAHRSFAGWPHRAGLPCHVNHRQLLYAAIYILTDRFCRVSGVAGAGSPVPGWRIALNVICETAMTHVSPYGRARARLIAGWRNRAVTFKAISFAMIGVVNSAVDYGAFLIARALLDRSAAAIALFASISGLCECGSGGAISLIAAN